LSLRFLLGEKMNSQRGASVLEVIFAIALVMAITPFMFNQISEMTHTVKDVSAARDIVNLRGDIVNYVRANQQNWPNGSIEISDEDLADLAPDAHAGIIYKDTVQGATITEIYLAFAIDASKYRASNIAKYIGNEAAIVHNDNIAYSDTWSVTAPDSFNSGDLIYRITRDFEGDNQNVYLHRGIGGGDNLNQMQRPLHMNNNDMVNVGNVNANNFSAHITTGYADYLNMGSDGFIITEGAIFQHGATINASAIDVSNDLLVNLQPNSKISGFSNITAGSLNAHNSSNGVSVSVEDSDVDTSFRVRGNLNLADTTISGLDKLTAYGNISALTITSTIFQLQRAATFVVSGDALAFGVDEFLSIGVSPIWKWTQPASDSHFVQGPTFGQIGLKGGSIVIDGRYANKLSLETGERYADENTYMGKMLTGCLFSVGRTNAPDPLACSF